MTQPKLTVFGKHDDKTLEQLRDVASRAERVALLADGHFGYIMPGCCMMLYELLRMR